MWEVSSQGDSKGLAKEWLGGREVGVGQPGMTLAGQQQ